MAITTASQSQIGQETAKNSQIVTTSVRLVNSGASTGPSISSIVVTDSGYNTLDDTAAAISNSYIRILGSNFTSTANVFLNGTMIPTANVTFVNSSELRAQLPVSNTGNYAVSVYNSNSSGALYSSSFVISTMPQWLTSTTLANVTSNIAFSNTLSATSDSSVTYSNTTILPTGFNLLSNGYYYGTITSANTYSFGVKATDVENQDSTRTFNLTVSAFLPVPTSIDYLLIAGGGAGGGSGTGGTVDGAGGGAGGWLEGTITGSGLAYTVTIGAGGASGSQRGDNSTLANSSITRLTYGGGMGGGAGSSQPYSYNGQDGGSGGGGGIHSGVTNVGNSIQTSNNGGTGYGNAGGANQTGAPYTGGGGGGAGAVGVSGTSGGAGGAGKQWLDGTYYAGGGGTGSNSYGAVNGLGGTGGGGTGGTSAGSTNTGGGGGGRMFAGGSGVCIFRYPDSFALATSTTGSPTVTTSGGYRYYKFTSSGAITFLQSYRYFRVTLNSVNGGGSQAQLTELSFRDSAGNYITQTLSSPVAPSAGSLTNLNNQNATALDDTNMNPLPFVVDYDMGSEKYVGTDVKFLRIGSSDDSTRYVSNITVSASNDNLNFTEIISGTPPSYAGIRVLQNWAIA